MRAQPKNRRTVFSIVPVAIMLHRCCVPALCWHTDWCTIVILTPNKLTPYYSLPTINYTYQYLNLESYHPSHFTLDE